MAPVFTTSERYEDSKFLPNILNMLVYIESVVFNQ